MIATPTDQPATRRPIWYYYLDRPTWTSDPAKPSYEVVNGVRVEKPMGAYETILANYLNTALMNYVYPRRLGMSFVGLEIELPVVGCKRKPDVTYLSTETWPLGRRPPDEAWWRIVPDLAVESISPNELTHATLAKVQEYFAAGVKAVWLLLPNVEQVYCYSDPSHMRILNRADTLVGDPVIPGFQMAVADLFPPSEPATDEEPV